MPTKVIMPQLGESVIEGTVGRWLIGEGQPVKEYDPLLTVTTDKVDTEIPAPASGTLLKILVAEGQTVAAGTLLALIGRPEEAGGEAPASPAAENAGHEDRPADGERRPGATPLAQRIAGERGRRFASGPRDRAGGAHHQGGCRGASDGQADRGWAAAGRPAAVGRPARLHFARSGAAGRGVRRGPQPGGGHRRRRADHQEGYPGLRRGARAAGAKGECRAGGCRWRRARAADWAAARA